MSFVDRASGKTWVCYRRAKPAAVEQLKEHARAVMGEGNGTQSVAIRSDRGGAYVRR